MFEYICSICGASPEDSPLVANAVLGLRDGLKLLPCCEDCYAAKKKPLTYGKADQPKAQAAKRARKAKQVEEAKRARQAGGHGRGRGRGRGQILVEDSSGDEGVGGGAHTPPPRHACESGSSPSVSPQSAQPPRHACESGSSPSVSSPSIGSDSD